jgi:hypothetical protein
MGGINVKRWIMGGLAAGVVMWVLEGAASMLYMEDMEAALQAHSLSFEMSSAATATTLLVSFLLGVAIVFFYAASRPRFGPGPATAVKIAVAFWLGGYFLSLLGYQMVGLYSESLLAVWGLVGLVEMILGALVGGWLYRESEHEATA